MKRPERLSSTEFKLGFADRVANKPRSENPFHWMQGNTKHNTKLIHWANGWDKADIELPMESPE